MTTTFDPAAYGPRFAALLREERLNALGPGTPNAGVRAELAALNPENAFAPRQVRDPDMALACLAGVWLYHDFLDEAHSISQEIHTPTGSYWHGIMHRREPDPSNAAYWFRRVGSHPVFPALCAEAARLAAADADPAAAFLRTQSAWDPFAFIDLCASCRDETSPRALLCRNVQQREWQLLFDHCYRQGIAP
jgi:ferric-dicitrate binding protein FerR (iron transport regulator)